MMTGTLTSVLRSEVSASRLHGAVRVCFLIDRLSRAGTETQLLALIRSLDRRRVLPHLVLLDGEDDLSRSLEPNDCPILRLGLSSFLRGAPLSAARSLRRFWRFHRIDILQTYFLDSTYFGVPFARLCGIRSVVRVRNNLGYWLTGRHRSLGRWMGRLADVTLTNSVDGKQALVESERLHPEKIVVLENGVDLERFPPLPPPDTRRAIVRVGVVANLRPVKNIDGLIRAASRLSSRYPTLHFSVAGNGEHRPELERLIHVHDLTERFTLPGSTDDVTGFLAQQDIAVLPSHSEGMSNALLEFMAAGRAIVATDVGANAQLIEHGVSGRIVPARHDDALAEALSWYMEHPAEAIKYGQAARKRVEAAYSRSAMVNRFENFYEQLRMK